VVLVAVATTVQSMAARAGPVAELQVLLVLRQVSQARLAEVEEHRVRGAEAVSVRAVIPMVMLVFLLAEAQVAMEHLAAAEAPAVQPMAEPAAARTGEFI